MLLPLYDEREARAVVRMLLEEKYGLSYADIITDGIDKISDNKIKGLGGNMARLVMGEPVQYVLGYAYFAGRRFEVAPGVLIPRPETEGLTSRIREFLDGSRQEGHHDFSKQEEPADNKNGDFIEERKRILDIGTGSGCIIITAALDNPGVYAEGWDISSQALKIARHNSRKLRADVVFRKRDILKTDTDETGEKWDVIVSNPPYIAEREKEGMSRNVLDYEPHTALFVSDADPLLFYRAICRYSLRHLNDNGRILFEINPLFADEMEVLMLSEGFSHSEIEEDDYGKKRYAIGWK